MATTIDNFASEGVLGVSAVSLFSTNSSEKKFIGKFTVTNTSDANVEVILWRLATATTPTTGSGGNWFVRETIPAGKSVDIYELIGHVLGPSMSVKGQAGVAAVVNYDASGSTET